MYNNIQIIGRLGRDPELKYTSNQTAVCKFSVATSEKVKKGSEWIEHTEWFNVVTFGKQAENISKYLSKGSQTFLEGSFRSHEYQAKDGNQKRSYEVIARSVRFLSPKKAQDSNQSLPVDAPSTEAIEGYLESGFDDDDIPF